MRIAAPASCGALIHELAASALRAILRRSWEHFVTVVITVLHPFTRIAGCVIALLKASMCSIQLLL